MTLFAVLLFELFFGGACGFLVGRNRRPSPETPDDLYRAPTNRMVTDDPVVIFVFDRITGDITVRSGQRDDSVDYLSEEN